LGQKLGVVRIIPHPEKSNCGILRVGAEFYALNRRVKTPGYPKIAFLAQK